MNFIGVLFASSEASKFTWGHTGCFFENFTEEFYVVVTAFLSYIYYEHISIAKKGIGFFHSSTLKILCKCKSCFLAKFCAYIG